MGIWPGHLVLLGSGETSASGRRVFDWLLQASDPPTRIAILETPAGFQPNSALVARKVADFLQQHLANYSLDTTIVPARRRGTPFGPDNPSLVDDVLSADCLFLGPGSPTYAVRQLRESILWDAVRARFATGASLVFASAAVLAISAFTLPVYEIYKAGADLEWVRGLDLLGPAGQKFVFIPHWNNREGGPELDTSRCFIGRERFQELHALLPRDSTIVGIDEHTALILQPSTGTGLVMGAGAVFVERAGHQERHGRGTTFSLGELGDLDWDAFVSATPASLRERARSLHRAADPPRPGPSLIPGQVMDLVRRREEARQQRDWKVADSLRAEVSRLGYQVDDTPSGPRVRLATMRGDDGRS